MQIQTLVNVKYQVVIPKEARKKIKIKPGQRMSVEVEGRKVTLTPLVDKGQWKWPNDDIKNLKGLWKSSEDIEKYLEEEDKSWE